MEAAGRNEKRSGGVVTPPNQSNQLTARLWAFYEGNMMDKSECSEMCMEMLNLQLSIHDDGIDSVDILDALYMWEMRLREITGEK